MAVGWIDASVLTDIANAIRQQNGTDTTYLPREMAAAVQALDGTREGEGAVEPYKELESGVVSERVFAGIAAAIRQQNGGTDLYEPGDMAQAILDLTWETPELAPRALLLSDGTLEFTYLESEDSPSGGVVVKRYTPVEGITSASAPWWADRESITQASFHGSFADAGFTDPSYWFYGCKNMAEVMGFEAMSGATKMSYTFASCTALRTVYATEFDDSQMGSTFGAFYGTRMVCGGHGYTPNSSSGSATFKVDTASTGGILTDPDDDVREWANAYLYEDGLLEIALGAPLAGKALDGRWTLPVNVRFGGSNSFPWEARRLAVLAATFREDMATVDDARLDFMFGALSNMAGVDGLGNLGGILSASYCFSSCTGLAEADLSGMPLDVMERSGLSCLFYGDTALTTIYAQAGWSLPSGLMATSMFNNCRSLVGGAGTVYDSRKTGIEYFRIDNPPDAPGYLTAAE